MSYQFPVSPSESIRVVTSAGNITVTNSDSIIVVNQTTPAFTSITLPSSPYTGKRITIKDGSGTATQYILTILPASGTIDGAPSATINIAFGTCDLIYNGTSWSIISPSIQPPPGQQRLVFAWYILQNGPYGNNIAGYTQDIMDAQAIGIDGFQLDMFAWDQATTQGNANFQAWAGYMFQAAQNLGTGFKLFFTIDDQGYGTAGQTAAGAMMAAYANHPNYWHYASKPVMGAWESPSGTAGSADNTFWSGVLTAVNGQGVTPFFWPTFFGVTMSFADEPTSYTNTQAWFTPWIKGVSNGLGNWNYYLPDPIFPSNATHADVAGKAAIPYMANVSAWLSQIRLYWMAYNGGTSATTVEFLEYNGYEGMSNIWLDIINNNRTPFVCLNTWNDLTESYMCPATQAQLTSTMNTWSSLSAWSKNGSVTIVENAADPDGGQAAASWARTATSATYSGSGVTVAASALAYTFTVKAKVNTATNLALRIQGTFPHRADVVFNLTSGTISTAATATSTYTGASATITSLGNGWYTCTLTATSGTDTGLTGYLSFNSNNSKIDGTDSSATSSGWVYGMNMKQGSTPIVWPNYLISPDYLFSHVGFTQLNKYFIQWFKTGRQPIWPDSVYVAYRNGPMTATITTAPSTPTPTWNAQSHNATLDDIYVTTILTAPATVTVNSGGNVTNVSVGAGLVHTRVPFTVGATQTVQVVRSSTTILSITGAAISSSMAYHYNSNPLTYYAHT